MICDLCTGSGACDPCNGYGALPDSYPNAGDGADCQTCDSSGICPNCAGTGTTDHDLTDNEHGTDTDISAGVMTS